MVASNTVKTHILDQCNVEPPTEQKCTKLALTFFDIGWLYTCPVERLLFYRIPNCTKNHFLETIVPSLKKSLSQTLEQYLPVSGHIIFPPNSAVPYIHFQPGDSVPVTISEYCGVDPEYVLTYLSGNHSRNATHFHALVPELPKPKYEFASKATKVAVFALQITLFPNSGLCIGFTANHAIGDASSIVGFMKAWSSITRLGDGNGSLPSYDRSFVKQMDPCKELLNHHWNQIKNNFKLHGYSNRHLCSPFEANRVRATFILSDKQIQFLRKFVLFKNPSLTHLSSFSITCAFVWTCFHASSNCTKEELLAFPVDARARMNPPLRPAYFGNCLAPGAAVFTRKQVRATAGDDYGDGFVQRVVAIGEFIRNKVNKEDEIVRNADHWLDGWGTNTQGVQKLAITESPKFDYYETDFGWGNPIKFETLCIDYYSGCMSLCKHSRMGGSLEIGLSMPRNKMDAFAVKFVNGLRKFEHY